ncbi:MAG: hypothetical protein COA78_15855 [Blastopirellula sp.]|nr:MAG: hypothetical protein COA78_15855 [Blastopirellula sp.]
MTEALIALVALAAMEIVLGIDNIVFIAIVSGRLPEQQRPKARKIGLLLALVTRLLLLFTISLVMKADNPIFHWSKVGINIEFVYADQEAEHTKATLDHTKATLHLKEHPGDEEAKHDLDEAKHDLDEAKYHLKKAEHFHEELNGVSIKDLILFFGGLFLIWKSVHEIHEKFSHHEDSKEAAQKVVTFSSVITQIVLLDIIFSLDSVITAVGMVKSEVPFLGSTIPGLYIMIVAVLISVGIMVAFANPISDFVEKHPTLKMLALSFLILIGVMLVAEGAGTHFDKGYVYFAMAFALGVEMLNLRLSILGGKQAPAAE